MIPTTGVQKGTLTSDVSSSVQLAPAVDEDDAAKTVDKVEVANDDTVKKDDILVTFIDGSELEAPANRMVSGLSIYNEDRVNVEKVVMHLTDNSDLSRAGR